MGNLFSFSHPISPVSTTKITGFEKKILDYHNKARTENGLEPLVWDKALQQKAADWNLHMQQENQGVAICRDMRHPGTGQNAEPGEVGTYLPSGNGQNLYQANALRFENNQWVPYDSSSPEEAVRKWYDECNMWKMPPEGQDVPDRFMEIGHLTQLLWKDARRVGCSSIQCRDVNLVQGKPMESKGKIINCHYDKGNVAGEFREQVPNNIKCELKNAWVHE